MTIPNKDVLDRFAEPAGTAAMERIADEIRLPGWRGRRPFLLSVGRLIEQKNYLRMLATYERFAATHPQAAWVIVGGGPQRADLTKRIHRRGLDDAACLLDRDLTADELAELYQHADALLFVSRFEGHGRVAFEALACDSVAEIADALERVASGEVSRWRLGERCREVASRYDLARVNPLEADLYRRLLSGGAP